MVILKRFTLICIWKKNKSLMIATHIKCLIYTIFLHILCKNNTNPTIRGERVKCNYFLWPSKFKMWIPPQKMYLFIVAICTRNGNFGMFYETHLRNFKGQNYKFVFQKYYFSYSFMLQTMILLIWHIIVYLNILLIYSRLNPRSKYKRE
jgi:hypothetical protein